MRDDRQARRGACDGGARPPTEAGDGSSVPADALDLRHLPAPLPLEQGIAAAAALLPGASLVLLTPMLPVPLLQLLQAEGFEVQALALADGSARIDIRRAPA